MNPKRNRASIRSWLVARNITVQAVADAAGVDVSIACRAMSGENNNRRVLRTLVSLGCPANLLVLPADMLSEQAA